MDHVHHSNTKQPESEPIISQSEAVPLHPTHTHTHSGDLGKKVVGGFLLCLLKNEFESCTFSLPFKEEILKK